VAEYENARKKLEADPQIPPLWDFYDEEAGKRIFEKADPISDLIYLAAVRWPHWLGWLDHDFVLKIKYEDLRLRTLETTQKIYHFAKETGIPDARTMARGAEPKEGNPTFRKGTPGDWRTTFEFHHMVLAKELLSETMDTLGYAWT
jgi:hypothetical protein